MLVYRRGTGTGPGPPQGGGWKELHRVGENQSQPYTKGENEGVVPLVTTVPQHPGHWHVPSHGVTEGTGRPTGPWALWDQRDTPPQDADGNLAPGWVADSRRASAHQARAAADQSHTLR